VSARLCGHFHGEIGGQIDLADPAALIAALPSNTIAKRPAKSPYCDKVDDNSCAFRNPVYSIGLIGQERVMR
jgi:hypothetical protein